MIETKDIAAFLGMSSFWALNYPLVKFGLLYEPPLVVLLFRVLFGAIFSLLLLARNFEVPKDLKTHLNMLIVAILNVVLFMGLWFTGEQYESSSISSIIVYTYPIFAMAFSAIFLGDRPGIYKILGTIVGFVGIIFIFADQLYVRPNIGLVLLLLSAISWAIGTIYFKRYLTSGNVPVVNAFQNIYALPIIALWAFLAEPMSLKGLNINFVGITLYMGLFGSAMAYYIFFHLIKKYNVSSISAFFFAVPGLSIIFGYFILGEMNSMFTYAGFALISIGIYLTSKNGK